MFDARVSGIGLVVEVRNRRQSPGKGDVDGTDQGMVD